MQAFNSQSPTVAQTWLHIQTRIRLQAAVRAWARICELVMATVDAALPDFIDVLIRPMLAKMVGLPTLMAQVKLHSVSLSQLAATAYEITLE